MGASRVRRAQRSKSSVEATQPIERRVAVHLHHGEAMLAGFVLEAEVHTMVCGRERHSEQSVGLTLAEFRIGQGGG